MLVTSLEKAESIVERNSMLEWDGWNIIHVRRNNAAWMQKNGMFRNGKWHQRTVIAPSERGWNVPDKYVR